MLQENPFKGARLVLAEMPYPIAHPAAVLPLVRPLGRYAVLPALVIGSIVPDLWYFVPLATRELSHSPEGLFVFSVPLGLILYWLFHVLLKEPLIALLPAAAAARLAPLAAPGLPAHRWRTVVLCLLAGAVTHLAWDSFTHEEGVIVEKFPAFEAQIFAIGSYPVRVYQLLQHASTLLGSAFVCWRAWRAFKRLPAGKAEVEVFSVKTRLLIIAALAAVSAAWAELDAVLPQTLDPLSLRGVLRSVGLDAAQALVVGVLAYCAATTWLLGRSRASRSPAGR